MVWVVLQSGWRLRETAVRPCQEQAPWKQEVTYPLAPLGTEASIDKHHWRKLSPRVAACQTRTVAIRGRSKTASVACRWRSSEADPSTIWGHPCVWIMVVRRSRSRMCRD